MVFFFFQAEDGIRDGHVTGVQTCALPILCCTSRPGCSHPPRKPSWPTGSARNGTPTATASRNTATSSTETDSDKLPPNSDLPQRPPTTSPPRVRIEVLSERKPTVVESGRTRTSGTAQRRRARRQRRRSALGGPRGARRATPTLADQHGSHLTLRPCPGRSKPVEFGQVRLRGARRLEERGGGRAPQQPYSSSADQPGRDERLDATVVQ